jgi:hypothetical protein
MRKPSFRFDLQQFTDPPAGDPPADPPKLPVDPPTPEPDPKLDDHAKSVIKRLNDEARANREAKEKVERELADAKKKIDDREKADLADSQKFKELADRLDAEKKALEAQYASDIATRDKAIVREAIARAAAKAGITDEDDIDLPVFADAMKLAKVENGRVIGADDVVEKMRETKPAKFKTVETETPEQKAERERKEADERARDPQGRFTRPTPNKDVKDKNALEMSEAEFAAARARLTTSRA